MAAALEDHGVELLDERRVGDEHGRERVLVDLDERRLRDRPNRRQPRLAGQQADLAERRPGLEHGDLPARRDVPVDGNGHAAGRDQEHGRARVALADDDLAFGKSEATGSSGELAPLLVGQGREERAVPDLLRR